MLDVLIAGILLVLLITVTFLKFNEDKNETYDNIMRRRQMGNGMMPGTIMYISADYHKFIIAYEDNNRPRLKTFMFKTPRLNHDKGGRVYLFKTASGHWDFK